MHRLVPEDRSLVESIDERYGHLAESAESDLARDLHKQRPLASNEQPKHRRSGRRKRTRRHVQMIRIDAPGAENFRKDDPEVLLKRSIATKTSSTNAAQAFRPIRKKHSSFKRGEARNME